MPARKKGKEGGREKEKEHKMREQKKEMEEKNRKSSPIPIL